MSVYIIDRNTSVIPVDTRYLQGGSTSIVYISSTDITGQIVTIYDVFGHLSSPQSIVVSSLSGIPFLDRLYQRFSYLTLHYGPNSTWTSLYENAISNPNDPYSIRGLTFSTLSATTTNISGIVSSIGIEATDLRVQSSFVTKAPLFCSTLSVNSTIVGNVMDVNGSMYAGGNVSTLSSIQVSQNATLSSITLQGPISTLGNLRVGSTFTYSANLSVQGQLSTGFTTLVQGQLSTFGSAQFGPSRTTGNLQVSSFTGRGLNTTYLSADPLTFANLPVYHTSRPDISVVDPTYSGVVSPVVEVYPGLTSIPTIISDWTTASYMTARGVLQVSTAINAPSLSSLVLSSTAIQNPAGSLTISSIVAQTMSYNTILGPGEQPSLNDISTTTIGVSSMSVTAATIGGYMNLGSMRSGLMVSQYAHTSSLQIGDGSLITGALVLSSIFIISSTNTDQLSSIVIPAGSLQFGPTYSGAVTAPSTIVSTLYTNQINSGNSFRIAAPTIRVPPMTISSFVTGGLSASSIAITSIQLGVPLEYSTITPNGLYLVPSTIVTQTRYEYVTGIGAVYNPIHAVASTERSVNFYPGNVATFPNSYINAEFTYTNNGSGSGSAGLKIVNSNAQSTIIYFNANPIVPVQRISLYNYPVDLNMSNISTLYNISGVASIEPISNIDPRILVAVGNRAGGGGSFAYSRDGGQNWSGGTTGIFDGYSLAVAWNGQIWLAVGAGSQNTLAYSYTGTEWFGLGLISNGKCIAWGGTQWLLAGTGGSMKTSYDGLLWTSIVSPFTTDINAVATNGIQWVTATANCLLAYTYNLIAWYIVPSPFTTNIYAIATNGTEWVVVGEGAYTIAHSYDGIVWTGVSAPFTTRGVCVAWNGAQWVAGGVGTYQVASSPDGVNWTGSTTTGNVTSVVATTAATWIATTDAGDIVQSTDGLVWSSVPGSTIFSLAGVAICSRKQPSFTEFLCTTKPSSPFVYSIGRKSWTIATTIISGQANSFAWNGRRWVAGLQGGLDTIAYSDDGINWIGIASLIFTTACFQIAWNGYMWIATGSGTNTLAYSYDAIHWTGLGSTIFTTAGYGIAAGGGIIVATGEGTNTLAYSYNGIAWVGGGAPFFSSGRKLVYSGSLWVAGGLAVAGPSPVTLINSPDGIVWTASSQQPFDLSAWDIATNGSSFLAVGNTTLGTRVAYSPDGNNWISATGPSVSGKGVAWTGTKWAITGATTLDPIIYVSSDGLIWSSETASVGPAYTLSSKTPPIPYDSVMIACGSSASNLMAITYDGFHWVSVTTPFTDAYCASWNGVKWVAGGAGTYQIASSPDGINWTGVTLSNMTAIRAVTCSASGWVAVGEGTNTYATSADGIHWTTYNATFVAAYGVIYANGRYIAAGTTSGGLATSLDGVTWTPVGGTTFSTGTALSTNGTTIVAVGRGLNTIAVQKGGTSWTALGDTIFTIAGNGIAFGRGVWVAVGEGGNTIAISTDGYAWTGLGLGIFSVRGTGVAWNGKIFVASGEGTNTLATSPDGIIWTGQGATTFTSATYGGHSGRANSVAARRIEPFVATSTQEGASFRWKAMGQMAALSQTTIQKSPNASSAWDSVIYSLDGFTQTAYLSFTIANKADSMMGLSAAPMPTLSSLNYAFSFGSGGQLDIYEQGFYVNNYGTYAVGDIFQIIFNGTSIKYYKNYTLLYTRPRSVGNILYVSAMLYIPGATIEHIEFHSNYAITSSAVAQSDTAFTASTEPVIQSMLAAPFNYIIPTSNVPVSTWNFNVALGGNVSTSFYADVYINQTKLISTNVIDTTYISTLSTYQISFSLEDQLSVNAGDNMNIRLMGTKQQGDLYIYGNWLSTSGPNISSSVLTLQGNPNGLEYLQLFHHSAQGLQTSEISLWLSPTSTINTTTYVNSNYGIEMNKGYMTWNSPLWGTTIQNRFNDIATRSLTYTGALYNASDKNLKRDIEYISSIDYQDAFMSIPLRRFAFSDAYCSTFQTEDRHQLGVITAEVKRQFPTAVHSTDINLCGLSTIESVDRPQLRYLHLSATQGLLIRISTLCERINHLRYLGSLVEARSG